MLEKDIATQVYSYLKVFEKSYLNQRKIIRMNSICNMHADAIYTRRLGYLNAVQMD